MNPWCLACALAARPQCRIVASAMSSFISAAFALDSGWWMANVGGAIIGLLGYLVYKGFASFAKKWQRPTVQEGWEAEWEEPDFEAIDKWYRYQGLKDQICLTGMRGEAGDTTGDSTAAASGDEEESELWEPVPPETLERYFARSGSSGSCRR